MSWSQFNAVLLTDLGGVTDSENMDINEKVDVLTEILTRAVVEAAPFRGHHQKISPRQCSKQLDKLRVLKMRRERIWRKFTERYGATYAQSRLARVVFVSDRTRHVILLLFFFN